MSGEQTNQRLKKSVYFKNLELDLYLQGFPLNYITYGGATEGEIFRAASQVDERKPETWKEAWFNMAARVEAIGDQCKAAGHLVSARDAYLRAFTYYRTGIMGVRVTHPDFQAYWEKLRAAFRKAIPLFAPPIEALDIPFEGKSLPAYFMKPLYDHQKCPTVIVIGGGDTYAEDLYFWGGAAALARGYNVLAVDLPGQGATPLNGMHHIPNTEMAMKEVVNTLLQREEVDPDRIVIYGVSLGGYLVLRSVAFEKRIRACAASSPLVNLKQWILDAMPTPLRIAPMLWKGSLMTMGRFFNAFELIGFEKFFEWQMGCTSLKGALDKFEHMTVPVEQIACPVLCMVSENEGQTFHTQTNLCYQTLTSPKKLFRFSEQDGADAHTQAGNVRLAHQIVFDWFDDVLGQQANVLETAHQLVVAP